MRFGVLSRKTAALLLTEFAAAFALVEIFFED